MTDKIPKTAKVSDVLPYFRVVKRFLPAETKTKKTEDISDGSFITSLDYDDTGELAVICRSDESLLLYNCKKGQQAKEILTQKYGSHLARFTHASSSVVMASTKGNHDLRHLSTHDNSYIAYFKGHTGRVTSLTMSPANDDFLSCSMDDTMRLWSLKYNEPTHMLNLRGSYISNFDPTASVIATASSYSHEIFLYDVRNLDKQPFATFDLRPYYEHYIGTSDVPTWTKLEFSNDGKHILIASTTGGHMIIDSFSGQLKSFCKRLGSSLRAAAGQDLTGRTAVTQGDVCFTPDGRFLIGGSGKEDGLAIWNLAQESKLLDPAIKLPYPPNNGIKDRAEICAYNPRYNYLMSADEALNMWYPDPDLYAPIV